MYDSCQSPSLLPAGTQEFKSQKTLLSVNGETSELAEQIILVPAGLSHSKDS